MDPLLILAMGMVVVIGAVLWLKLHAFLALMLGALVVALLTPNTALVERELDGAGRRINQVDQRGLLRIDTPPEASPLPAGNYAWMRNEANPDQAGGPQQKVGRYMGRCELNRNQDGYDIVTTEPVDADLSNGAAPVEGDILIPIAEYRSAIALRDRARTARIANGFANTCGKIGIIIALAAIIGQCLLDSGAAERIVDVMRRRCGERNTPAALTLSGFLIGIPVYFDTVFYLLLPLARALGHRNRNNYLLYVLAIIVGATMAHSLVPPTPGPLLVASELNVELGTMILAGGAVGLISVASGFLYALWANRRWTIDVPSLDATKPIESRLDYAPPLHWSLMPIVLPVVLLAIGTFLKANAGADASEESYLRQSFLFLSDKHIALAIATVIAITMLVRFAKGRIDWIESVSGAIASAGSIVLITAAGGAFGHVLRQSGIADAIQSRFPATESGTLILLIAFGVTAIVRVAQGSATVAMITAVGIVAPLVSEVTLDFHPVYVALAIGCGSKPMPWMNDSGFWVITRMSGMTEAQSLKTFSVVLTIMGVVGLGVTLAGATWVPLK